MHHNMLLLDLIVGEGGVGGSIVRLRKLGERGSPRMSTESPQKFLAAKLTSPSLCLKYVKIVSNSQIFPGASPPRRHASATLTV